MSSLFSPYEMDNFERDNARLSATVLSVHSSLGSAIMAKLSYKERNGILCEIKESSNGYGFVVYSYHPKAKKHLKYDLSHML